MNKSERFLLVMVNLMFLIGGIIVIGWLHFCCHTPQQERTPEEYRALIEKKTSDPKLQTMFINDDEYIRTLEHLAAVQKTGVLIASILMSLLAMFNLVLILRVPPKSFPSPARAVGGRGSG